MPLGRAEGAVCPGPARRLLLAVLVGAAAGCLTDHDCQLNGHCQQGRCACDPAWAGEHCEVLQTDGAGQLAYGGLDWSVSSWGGGPPVLDPVSGPCL